MTYIRRDIEHTASKQTYDRDLIRAPSVAQSDSSINALCVLINLIVHNFVKKKKKRATTCALATF